MRPILPSYSIWTGFYGGVDDNLTQTAVKYSPSNSFPTRLADKEISVPNSLGRTIYLRNPEGDTEAKGYAEFLKGKQQNNRYKWLPLRPADIGLWALWIDERTTLNDNEARKILEAADGDGLWPTRPNLHFDIQINDLNLRSLFNELESKGLKGFLWEHPFPKPTENFEETVDLYMTYLNRLEFHHRRPSREQLHRSLRTNLRTAIDKLRFYANKHAEGFAPQDIEFRSVNPMYSQYLYIVPWAGGSLESELDKTTVTNLYDVLYLSVLSFILFDRGVDLGNYTLNGQSGGLFLSLGNDLDLYEFLHDRD